MATRGLEAGWAGAGARRAGQRGDVSEARNRGSQRYPRIRSALAQPLT